MLRLSGVCKRKILAKKKSRDLLAYSINITPVWRRVERVDIYFASSSAIAFSILIFKSTAVRIEEWLMLSKTSCILISFLSILIRGFTTEIPVLE